MATIKNLLPERNNIKCPYCDSEVSYIQALSEVSTGEHTCPVCNKNSNIKYDKKIYLPAGILLGIAVIVTILLFLFDVKSNPILAICIVIIPFAVFFFLTPFYFKLQAIRSEAQTPVVKHKQKSKKRSEITPRAVKFEEKKRIQKEKEKEKKVMENKGNSFKSKFSKFVKTYILVDDDDDETEVKESAKNSDKEIKTKPVQEDKIERLPTASNVEAVEEDDEEINIEPEEEFVEDNGIDTVDPLAEDEEDLSFIEVYTDKKAYEKQTAPVYHKMTKTKKVDFIYLPEDKETISVNVKIEETTDNTDLDDEDDILNFFDSEPTAEEEKEFGVKKNEIQEVIHEDKKAEKEFSYTSENKESIAVSVKDDVADEDNFKFEDLETSPIENTAYRDAVNKFSKKQKSNSFLNKEEGETAEVADTESDENIKEYKKSSLQLSKPVDADFTDMLVENEIENADLEGNEDVLEYNPEKYYVVEDAEEDNQNEYADESIKNEVIKFSDTYVDTFPREDEDNKYATTSGEEIDLSEFKTSNYVESDSENVDLGEDKEEKENNEEVKTEEKTEEKTENTAETVVEPPKVVVKSISAPPAPKKVENRGKKAKKSFNGKNRNFQANSPVKEQSQAEKKLETAKADNKGFFSKIKSKLIDMTEEEREDAFNQEEKERKLAEKEARRKAKEKEKELAEKSKREKELAEIKQAKKENKAKKAEEAKNEKTIEKTKTENVKPVENESAADQKTKVFKIPAQEKVADDYKSQEKIVFESVKEKAAKFEDKKITQEEKVKIISEKDKEEKRQANINKQKAEQARKREQGEKQIRNKKLQNERQQKNEQYRQNQVKKAQESQNKIKQNSEKRNVNNVKLKDVNNVRSKVSQNQAKKREEINKFFKD